jgi:hypothetical protein
MLISSSLCLENYLVCHERKVAQLLGYLKNSFLLSASFYILHHAKML